MQSLAKTLSTPFGPYLDGDLLINPNVYKNPKDTVSREKRILTPKWILESLQLERGGELIGLNCFENGGMSDGPIRFRGVLQLRDIRHLTDQGKTWLIQELRNRGSDMGLDYCIKEQNFKVLIQSTLMYEPNHMIFPSTFLEVFSLVGPGRLVKRKYTVVSMHAVTYFLSRSYLRKYRLVHEVQAICAKDGLLPKHQQTLIEDRTMSWLVTSYLNRCRDRQDVGVHKRRVQRCEVYHLFGKHSTWLLGVFKKKKLLNVAKWEEFCEEFIDRRQARRQGWSKAEISQRWGSGEQEREVDDVTRRRGRREHRLEQVAQSSRQSVEIVESNFEVVFEENITLEERLGYDPEFGFRHDHEIIVSPPASEPSESDEDSRPSSPVNFEILNRIPPELCKQPKIPHDFIWDCSVQDCSYTLNLHELTDEDLEGVLPDDQFWLKRKLWTLQDERLQDLFYDMTERHYYKHLKEMGIGLLAYQPTGGRQLEPLQIDKYTDLPKKTKFKVERIKGSIAIL